MSESKSKTKDGRARNWTFIVYPESAPANWRSVLDNARVQWIESPLHEGEINPDNETEKKAHWHVLLLFPGHKSFEQIKEFTNQLNSTIPQVCSNAKGLVRYMAHLDNPEKKQYSTTDIIGHNGADVAGYLKATGAARYELIRDMVRWVRGTQCNELSELVEYAADERFEDWFPLLCDNSAYIMGEYIKSRRLTPKPVVIRERVDPETGEIIQVPIARGRES